MNERTPPSEVPDVTASTAPVKGRCRIVLTGGPRRGQDDGR